MMEWLPAFIASLVPLSWWADWLESRTVALSEWEMPDGWLWRGRLKSTGAVVWYVRLPLYSWHRGAFVLPRIECWHKLELWHRQGEGWYVGWWPIPSSFQAAKRLRYPERDRQVGQNVPRGTF